MRLIDADELPEVNTIERIDGEREVFVNSWVPAMAIWEAPTVEAIPVGWIRKWQTQHSAIIAGYISYMLLDWEKENEQ